MGKYGAVSRRLASEEKQLKKDVKRQQGAMNGSTADEIASQNEPLDDMECGISHSNDDGIEARPRMLALERDPYNLKNFCALLTPVVLLFVMFLLLIRRVLVS